MLMVLLGITEGDLVKTENLEWRAIQKMEDFYRAMHFSAKRGIAIACRLSVCLSVCNVGEL